MLLGLIQSVKAMLEKGTFMRNLNLGNISLLEFQALLARNSRPMALRFGTILGHLGSFGTILCHLGPFGTIWDHLGPLGTI